MRSKFKSKYDLAGFTMHYSECPFRLAVNHCMAAHGPAGDAAARSPEPDEDHSRGCHARAHAAASPFPSYCTCNCTVWQYRCLQDGRPDAWLCGLYNVYRQTTADKCALNVDVTTGGKPIELAPLSISQLGPRRNGVAAGFRPYDDFAIVHLDDSANGATGGQPPPCGAAMIRPRGQQKTRGSGTSAGKSKEHNTTEKLQLLWLPPRGPAAGIECSGTLSPGENVSMGPMPFPPRRLLGREHCSRPHVRCRLARSVLQRGCP